MRYQLKRTATFLALGIFAISSPVLAVEVNRDGANVIGGAAPPALPGLNDMSALRSGSAPVEFGPDGNPLPVSDVLTPQEMDVPDLTTLDLTSEEVAGLSPEEAVLLAAQQQMKEELAKLDKIQTGIPSLFFNREEHARLQRVLKNYDHVATIDPNSSMVKADPFIGIRELKLGGIFYKQADDWIIWLNNQRVTPAQLPRDVQDIKVFKGYIEVKWNDAANGKVHAIRLRPNQRFNLDTRSFAPG